MSINTNSIYGIYGMEYQLRAANDDFFPKKKKQTLSLWICKRTCQAAQKEREKERYTRILDQIKFYSGQS